MANGGYYHGDDYIDYGNISNNKHKANDVICPDCKRPTPYQPRCIHCGRRLY